MERKIIFITIKWSSFSEHITIVTGVATHDVTNARQTSGYQFSVETRISGHPPFRRLTEITKKTYTD